MSVSCFHSLILLLKRDARVVLLAGLVALGLGFASEKLHDRGIWIPQFSFPVDAAVDFEAVALEGVRQASTDPRVIIIDARPSLFFEAGHIPRAIDLPVGATSEALQAALKGLPPNTPIIVYCSEAECTDSLKMANRLRAGGYPQIQIYRGGWEEWSAAGLPQEP